MPQHDLQRYFLPLLHEHVRLTPSSRVLEQGYYDPSGALWAAGQAGSGGRVLALRPAIDLASELEALASEAGVGESNLEVRLGDTILPSERASFDICLVLAPFFLGNTPVRRAIATAAAALKPDGDLYLQVHRRHGGTTYLRMAEDAFHGIELLGMGGGQRRLYLCRGPKAPAGALVIGEQASSAAGDSGASTPASPDGAGAFSGAGTEADGSRLVSLDERGLSLRLRLVAGVFSARGIDPGSRLLVRTMDIAPGARVLDLGCGAGTLGLAVAAMDGRSRVTLVDTSRSAVDLSRENASRNALTNVDVRLGDGYAAVEGERFDSIISNLPAHRGVQHDTRAAERFIAGAPRHLRPDGDVWVVANKALPYEITASRAFREVRTVAVDGRYKVLRCSGPRQS